jgi:hypothetical protein
VDRVHQPWTMHTIRGFTGPPRTIGRNEQRAHRSVSSPALECLGIHHEHIKMKRGAHRFTPATRMGSGGVVMGRQRGGAIGSGGARRGARGGMGKMELDGAHFCGANG